MMIKPGERINFTRPRGAVTRRFVIQMLTRELSAVVNLLVCFSCVISPLRL